MIPERKALVTCMISSLLHSGRALFALINSTPSCMIRILDQIEYRRNGAQDPSCDESPMKPKHVARKV